MDDAGTIATHYALDPAQPAPALVCGLRTYAAIDRRDPGRKLVALAARADLPPRHRLLNTRGATPVPHALMPLDQGLGRDPAGQDAWFMICAAPPGPALSVGAARWSESEVLRCLLVPAAGALQALAERGVTHRAIRPDNIFRPGPGEPVTLGPAWAVPPASLQPDAFEPTYSALCLPAGRGEGSIADDVYALGVTLLWCVLGGAAAWADGPTLLRRKLELGSLAALLGGVRLTPSLQDLLTVMLAEEPDHRPPPSLLLEPSQARSRRLAMRPPQRAARALEIGAESVWSARELAAALSRNPDHGASQFRSGAVDRWVRRMLGDATLAVQLEETAQRRAAEAGTDDSRVQAMLIMAAVAVLDPLAPLIWRGAALFPDGLGALLAASQAPAQAPQAAMLEELVAQDAITHWCACQTRPRDVETLKKDARDWRGWLAVRGPMGGARRLLYALNPLLPCFSPLLAGRMAVRLTDLLPALEAAAPRADRKRPPIDAHIAAFVAARADQALLVEIGQLDGFESPAERLEVLAFFARLQQRTCPTPLRALAAWLLECGVIDLTRWRCLATRQRIGKTLAEQAEAGQIAPIMALAVDRAAQDADRTGAALAEDRLAAIAAELDALRDGAARRADIALKSGHEIAAGAGLLATLGAALYLALTI